MSDAASEYTFTTDWFSNDIENWTKLLEMFKPSSVLEVGSFEGRSACFLIEKIGAVRSYHITCVDAWDDACFPDNMAAVEERFDDNVKRAQGLVPHEGSVSKIKGKSADVLPHLLVSRAQYDMVYIDASHAAPDVLMDAVMCFPLCKSGGLIVFDDYLWGAEEGRASIMQAPKPAIDAFTSVFHKSVEIVPNLPLYQLYLRKL